MILEATIYRSIYTPFLSFTPQISYLPYTPSKLLINLSPFGSFHSSKPLFPLASHSGLLTYSIGKKELYGKALVGYPTFYGPFTIITTPVFLVVRFHLFPIFYHATYA